MTTKQLQMSNRTTTRKIELVETHNIALSLGRIWNAPNSGGAWQRALYHALTMSDFLIRRETLVKIREALELP